MVHGVSTTQKLVDQSPRETLKLPEFVNVFHADIPLSAVNVFSPSFLLGWRSICMKYSRTPVSKMTLDCRYLVKGTRRSELGGPFG